MQAGAVELRVYIGYGISYLPYALSKLARQPRLLLWLAKDLLGIESRRLRREVS